MQLYCVFPGNLCVTLLKLFLVVHRSSETSTNQSDVIIRSDDRFLNLGVDSDSIVSKIYMLNFVLWLVFFSLHTDKHLAVLSSVLLTLSEYTYLDQSTIYLFHGIVHFISDVTHMENDLLFCSKLMFTNGKIVICKYII